MCGGAECGDNLLHADTLLDRTGASPSVKRQVAAALFTWNALSAQPQFVLLWDAMIAPTVSCASLHPRCTVIGEKARHREISAMGLKISTRAAAPVQHPSEFHACAPPDAVDSVRDRLFGEGNELGAWPPPAALPIVYSPLYNASGCLYYLDLRANASAILSLFV